MIDGWKRFYKIFRKFAVLQQWIVPIIQTDDY